MYVLHFKVICNVTDRVVNAIKYFRCKKINKVFTSKNNKSLVSTQIEIPKTFYQEFCNFVSERTHYLLHCN